MSRTYEYKILFPDARLDGKKTPLAKSLDQAGMSVHTRSRSGDPPDAVLTWFHGRSRISPRIHKIIKSVKCPIIGIEMVEEGNRNDPIARLDFQLSHDTPFPLIGHTIRRIVEFTRMQKEVSVKKAKYDKIKTQLDKMVDLGIQLTGTLSHHELFDLVVSYSASLVPGQIHTLFIIDQSETSCRLRASSKLENCNNYRITPTHRLRPEIKESLSSSSAPVSDNFPFDNHSWLKSINEHIGNHHSILVAPFLSKQHLLGFLVIGRDVEHGHFSKDEIERIELLSSFSSMAMANAYIYEQTETASRTDDLTNVYNFGFIKQFLDRLIAAGESFSLIFIDLDGFKKVNLEFGHTTGNLALKAAAGKILSSLVPYSMTGRFGGDEFVTVIPGANIDDAKKTATDLIKAIESIEEENKFRLSASAGIAEFPTDGSDLNSLIHAADTAMYTAKNRGRGQAVTFRELQKEN